MKRQILILFLSIILFSCKLPTVGYLPVHPFIKAYKTDIAKNLTVVLDAAIPDSLTIISAGIKPMTVKEFRQTLEDAFTNTFKSTYDNVTSAYSPDQNGISIVFVKIQPNWNKKSSKTIVSGQVSGESGHISSSTKYEMQSQILYQAIVYNDGEKVGVIDGTSYSEKTTFKRKETPDVFQDAIKIMCEDVYKQIIEFK